MRQSNLFGMCATPPGADVGTMPYPVFEKLWKHPMTDIGLERFLADWKKAKGS